MSKGLKTTKPNKRDEIIIDAVLSAPCRCVAIDCCGIPHIKIKDATDADIDLYIWNEGGVQVTGVKADYDAAVLANK